MNPRRDRMPPPPGAFPSEGKRIAAPSMRAPCPACGGHDGGRDELDSLRERVAQLQSQLEGSNSSASQHVTFRVREPPDATYFLPESLSEEHEQQHHRPIVEQRGFYLARLEGIGQGRPKMRSIFAGEGIRRLLPNHTIEEDVIVSETDEGPCEEMTPAIEGLLRARETKRPTTWKYTTRCANPNGRSNSPEDAAASAEDSAQEPRTATFICIGETLGESVEGPLFLVAVYHQDFILQQQLLRRLLGAVESVFLWADTSGKVLYVHENKFFDEFTGGCTREDFEGWNWFQYIEDRRDPHEIIEEIRTNNVSDFVFRRKCDGHLVYMKMSSFPFREPMTGEWFRVGYLVDGKMEKELLQRNEELEAAQKELLVRNEQLEQALALAEEASKVKSLLLANVSHELRTPLNGLLGMVQVLRQAPSLPKDEQDSVEAIWESGEWLRRVIEDLLEFSRIHMGNVTLEDREFNVHTVLDSVHSTITAASEHKADVTCSYQIASDVPVTLVGDADRLRQIFVNLVGNAHKLTDSGRVDVRVALASAKTPSSDSLPTPPPFDAGEDASILEACAKAAERAFVAFPSRARSSVTLHCEIEDSGIGIPAHLQEKLFKPFSQIDSSTSRRYGGTGLGLAITKTLVERFGGRIWVRSHEGKGSIFSFTLHLQVPSTLTTVNAVPSSASSISLSPGSKSPRLRRAPFCLAPDSRLRTMKPRILLAEDNLINQKVITRFLSLLTLQADVAINGREAVDFAWAAARAGKPYQVVLMDLQMPEVTGYEATGLIRAWPADTPQPRIVAVTANASRDDMEKCREAGMEGFLVKPIQLESLVRVLEEFVDPNSQHEM